MASVLLVTWDGAGNLPPERALVRALMARGHTVRVLAHETVRAAIERDGAEFLPIRGARHYHSKEAMSPEAEMPYVLEHIWFARAFGTELRAAAERFRPDLLMVDFSLICALVAARRSGLPTVVLGHCPYELLAGPFGPVLDSRLEATNAYAAELGVEPIRSHQSLIESFPLVLVASYRPFDGVKEVAPNIVHVGPCRASGDVGEPWTRRAPGRPLVLVGLSTSNQNQVPLLQRLCDALGSLDVEALVTTGPAVAPDALRPAANTTVLQFVSHDRVLPSADLLVTHAGHGTVMAGATYGVPMLCFPMGRDQPMNAARVAQLGIGRVADADAPVEEIRRAIAAVLGDAGTKTRARDFAASVASHRGLDDAIALVEKLLPNRT
jgi:UDP:flavonoid glycosyltransferase YjiC (YdhE family)